MNQNIHSWLCFSKYTILSASHPRLWFIKYYDLRTQKIDIELNFCASSYLAEMYRWVMWWAYLFLFLFSVTLIWSLYWFQTYGLSCSRVIICFSSHHLSLKISWTMGRVPLQLVPLMFGPLVQWNILSSLIRISMSLNRSVLLCWTCKHGTPAYCVGWSLGAKAFEIKNLPWS